MTLAARLAAASAISSSDVFHPSISSGSKRRTTRPFPPPLPPRPLSLPPPPARPSPPPTFSLFPTRFANSLNSSAKLSSSSLSAASTAAIRSIFLRLRSASAILFDTSSASLASARPTASRCTSSRRRSRASGSAAEALSPRMPLCTMSRSDFLPSAKTVRSTRSSVMPSAKSWQLQSTWTLASETGALKTSLMLRMAAARMLPLACVTTRSSSTRFDASPLPCRYASAAIQRRCASLAKCSAERVCSASPSTARLRYTMTRRMRSRCHEISRMMATQSKNSADCPACSGRPPTEMLRSNGFTMGFSGSWSRRRST